MEEHTHDEENVCPTCLMAGMESERNRILGVVQNAPAIRDDNGYEIGIDRQALKEEITK